MSSLFGILRLLLLLWVSSRLFSSFCVLFPAISKMIHRALLFLKTSENRKDQGKEMMMMTSPLLLLLLYLFSRFRTLRFRGLKNISLRDTLSSFDFLSECDEKRNRKEQPKKKTSVRHTNGRPLNYVPERNFSFNFFFGHQILKYKSQIRDELTTKTQPAHVYVYI